ncbi:MAG TPA: PAS domain S-box protein [Gemmatimonadaceae bacterium]|nr:PAS domain S-box protein [Gemmatimonadaceae bacterium]
MTRSSILERDLFTLFEQTADAAYTVTDAGEICSWNTAAVRLFGYSEQEVLHRNIDDVFEARDALGTSALAGGLAAATRHRDGKSGGIENFDLEVRKRDGSRIWISVSTIVFESQRTGRRLFVRLAHDVSHRRHKEELLDQVTQIARQLVAVTEVVSEHAPVELLSEQERRILTLFAEGSTPGTIAERLNISGQTLRNHLHHINRKLRTHNRLEAVTHAQRRGLIG